MNYSLVPHWSKVQRPKFATYNARIETIHEKPTWREPLKTKRCLIGISSFFESCYQGSHEGNIVEFRHPDQKIWAIAGLWSEWIDPASGEVLESFAIVTTQPSKYIRSIGHDRSPLFIEKKNISSWLNQEPMSPMAAQSVLYDIHSPLENSQILIERPLKSGWNKD